MKRLKPVGAGDEREPIAVPLENGVGWTAKEARVSPPPRYSPDRIRDVRRALKVSQPVFADMLNVSGSTVRAWEQGVREPDGPTLRLLEIAEKHPASLFASLRERSSKDSDE